jgi:hypothetical protein
MKTIRIAALTLFAGGLAFAQAPDQPPATAPEPIADPAACPPDTAAVPAPDPALPLPVDPGYMGRAPKEMPKHIHSRVGLAVLAGGGVTNFFGNTANDRLNTGGSWTARVEIGTRSYLGGEFAYVGSAQGLKVLGTDTNAYLMSQGAEGLLRWNILTGAVQPYAGVGIGWKNYRLRNTEGAVFSDIAGLADFAHVPGVAGIEFRGGGFVFDTRFTVAGPISPTLISGSRLVSWDAGARLGFEF